MPKIAISYRRSDSLDMTGRIFDRLATYYGRQTVFRDIDNIRPGVDFRKQIAEGLEETNVLLAIIGPRWLGRQRGAETRLHDEADLVRIEIETALARKIPVIPVIVGGAKVPSVSQLPESIRPLAFHHAVTVDGGGDFDHHLNRLIRSLDQILGAKPTELEKLPGTTRRYATWAGLGAVCLIVAASAYLFFRPIFPPTAPAASRSAQSGGSLTAKEISNRYADAVAIIRSRWQMFDQATGQPLFHKVVYDSNTKELYPAFVKLPNGNIVRWLTFDSEGSRNIPVGGRYRASGFVAEGAILTTKFAMAPWTLPYEEVGWTQNVKRQGLVYSQAKPSSVSVLSLESPLVAELKGWIPDAGAAVFEAEMPVMLSSDDSERLFHGINVEAAVELAGKSESWPASLVRASTDADVALIRIETADHQLNAVELAGNEEVELGEKVVALGYSSASPIAVEGLVASVGGTAYQLNIALPGTIGGPVFNLKGKVIGLLSYSSAGGSSTANVAVPVERIRVLLDPRK